MISVYLKPDSTQILQGEIRKGILRIQDYKTIEQSYLGCMNGSDSEIREELSYFFSDIRGIYKSKTDEVYIVLPDYLFSVIDCFQTIDDAQLEDSIAQAAHDRIENVCYARPIITSPEPQQIITTACALPRRLVDLFVEAAKTEKVHLASIEPASVSYLRASARFNKEELCLTIFANQATFTGYSSNGGLFKMDAPELCSKSLSSMGHEEAEQTIKRYIAEFEHAALKTYEYLNQGLPYTIHESSNVSSTYAAIAERKAPKAYFPENLIDSGAMSDSLQHGWMAATGTLLQEIDFSDDEYSECIDPFMTVQSGNILPAEIQSSSKKFKQMVSLMKLAKTAIVMLSILSIAEIVAIFMFSSVSIPNGLQEDYDAGQQSIELINKELKVIELQEKEDQKPLEVYSTLLKEKPQEIGFSSFEVGSDTKPDPTKWVKVKMVAKDPMLFQGYVQTLSADSAFSGVALPKMTSDNRTGAKVAELILGKGDGK